LTPDEVWKLYAIDGYRQASKHPITNLLAKQDASKILGMLNQISDTGIIDEYRGMREYLGRPVNCLQNVMATMLHILVERRGLYGKV